MTAAIRLLPSTPLRGLRHHVKLTKTGDKATIADHPIFEGYTIWGYCHKLPEVGQPLQVLRYRRNDVEVAGVMTTSVVESVDTRLICRTMDCMTFETANSTYRLDFLPDEP